MGIIPLPGIRPRVGFRVYNAARLAGRTREPSVSVPIETGASPALTDTADPDEDPPVLCMIQDLA